MTDIRRAALVLVAAAISAPVATAQDVSNELYGEFRYSYNYAGAGDTTHWASANNASRLGVRGEVSERGLTAFVDLQTGVNIDAEGTGGAFTQRYNFAGIRGGFGTVTVGRQSTAYKMSGLRLDPFYDSSTISAGAGVPISGLFAGSSFGLSNLTNGFADRTVAYVSPSLSGITLNAAAYIDADSDHDYALGLGYRGHGLDAGFQYYDADRGRTWTQAVGIDHALRLHAGYARSGAWSVGASFERLEAITGGAQNFLYTVATLNPTRRLLMAGAVGHVGDDRDVQAITGTGFHLGVFYTLFQQARLHALYSRVNTDGNPDRSNVGLGLVYQFSIKP